MVPKSEVGIWMKLFPDDFKGGIDEMSTAEVGAYWLLLLHGWDNAGIPVSPSRLARIARMGLTEFETAWREVLSKKFEPHPDDTSRLVNVKQEKVRGIQEELYNRRKNGGIARWEGTSPEQRSEAMRRVRRANDEQDHEQPTSTPTSIRREGLGHRTQDKDIGLEGVGTEVPPTRKETLALMRADACPVDIPLATFESWVHDTLQFVEEECPKLHAGTTGPQREKAITQALVQCLSPTVEGGGASSMAAGDARRRGPIQATHSWFRDRELDMGTVGANPQFKMPRGDNWLKAVLVGGPVAGGYVLPGFGRVVRRA